MKLVTTHSRPCAPLGLAPLLSTLVLVGVAGVVLPEPCAAAVAGGTVAYSDASRSAGSPEWNVEPQLQDPADTSDEDDDDDPDAQQDASGVAVARGTAPDSDSSWRLGLGKAALLVSRALEGHYLRGPPAGGQEPCDFDDDSDDDYCLDYDSTALSARVRAPLALFFHRHHVRSRAHDGPLLRAP